VIALSRSGDVLDVNRAALEFTGWLRDMVIGRPIWAVAMSAESKNRLRAVVERAAAGEEMFVREQIADRLGRLRLLELSLNPVARDDDEVELLILVARDVTETSDALRQLIDSRAKYFGIVNIAADAIISVDRSFRITDFNAGAEQIFGYSAAEAEGQPLDLLLPTRFRTAHSEHMRQFGESAVSARRMGERREISAVRKGGEEFPADASISKQLVDGDRIYTVVLRDITRQKRAERSQRLLARAGGLLASSLDVSTTLESIARLSVDDGVADCCVIFDASEASIVRRSTLVSNDTRAVELIETHRGESLSTNSSHPAVRVVNTGEPMLVADTSELLGGPESDPDLELMRRLGVKSAVVVPLIARGRTGGAIGLYRTAADRAFGTDELELAGELAVVSALAIDNARLYGAARRAIRARDEILAVVSHDLGNPLAAIRIGATVVARLLGDTDPDGTAREQLGGIRNSVDQMDRLIRDLMDMERLDGGPLALGANPIRATTIVSSVIEMFNGIAAAKPVTLRSRVPAGLPPVRADRDRLVQALSNLLGNAIKFTQPGGTVELVVQLSENGLIFSVRDDGPGIDPARIDHIFDRFWKSGDRPGGSGGLGLGLAIVKGIVEAHGGRVWAESTPGNGTSIHFSIPLSRTAPAGSTVRSFPTSGKDIA
jgi:PAS domain S-box-containing protein